MHEKSKSSFYETPFNLQLNTSFQNTMLALHQGDISSLITKTAHESL